MSVRTRPTTAFFSTSVKATPGNTSRWKEPTADAGLAAPAISSGDCSRFKPFSIRRSVAPACAARPAMFSASAVPERRYFCCALSESSIFTTGASKGSVLFAATFGLLLTTPPASPRRTICPPIISTGSASHTLAFASPFAPTLPHATREGTPHRDRRDPQRTRQPTYHITRREIPGIRSLAQQVFRNQRLHCPRKRIRRCPTEATVVLALQRRSRDLHLNFALALDR